MKVQISSNFDEWYFQYEKGIFEHGFIESYHDNIVNIARPYRCPIESVASHIRSAKHLGYLVRFM